MAKKKVPTEAAVEEGQQHLPGMAPVKNPRIHPKAVRYAKLRDARIRAGEEEKAAHETLLTAMVEEGIEDYVYKGLSCHIDDTKKVKVKTKSAESPSNGEEE